MARVALDTAMTNGRPMLNDVPVRFDCDAHTYTMLDGTVLSGITGLLKERLFPTQYAGVDPEVLNNAAAYGSAVHRMCEAYDTVGAYPDNEDLHAYVGVKNEYELEHLCSEYLVTDCEKYSSCIDKVYEVDENTVDLADIKTTYSLNKEYVSWQLSVYAYLFEKVNPCIKVRNLYAIHLRKGEGKLVQVSRKDDIAVEGLLYTDGQAEAYAVPDDCKALAGLVYELTKQYNELSEKLGHAKAELMERMGETNASRWEYGRMQVIRKEGGVRKTFDSKRFEADHADMYGQYMKESESKPSITIKIK